MAIIFLTIFFGGFIAAVILIYKKRKKIWAKNEDTYHFNNDVYWPGDITTDDSHSVAGHHGPDSGDTDL